MYVCLLNQAGEIMLHHHMNTSPEMFLKAIAPYREDLIVAVECLLTWDLARRPLRPGTDALCPRPRSLYESDPRRSSQTR